ncbi:MAG: hypothetical protein V8S24_07295 [Gordonibacter pamelaeae]
MQVTLVSTTETLDVVRKLPDGTTEEVGSYQVAISDPAFVAKAEELVREIGARGLADARYDYGDLTEKSTGLVRSALGPEAARELLGEAPDMFNSMLLLTAVMRLVNELESRPADDGADRRAAARRGAALGRDAGLAGVVT